MKIKDGVNISGIRLPMRKVLIEAERIWQRYEQELVVTSGLEGTHSAGSLHYYGYALDFRTRYFDKETVIKVTSDLVNALSTKGDIRPYRVVPHKTHIHVEWRGLINGDT
jgi:hypothetical protein